MQRQQPQVFVMNENTKRETGRTAQLSNIAAARAVSGVVRSTLGPRSMLKMLLDPMGGIVLTNDGNAILRELDVSHPAAKSMIDLSRAQDEEVGDGTTTVIVLAGEMMQAAEQFVMHGPARVNLHPTQIVSAYHTALERALKVCDTIAKPFDSSNEDELKRIIKTCVGTKFTGRWGDLIVNMAHSAVKKVAVVADAKTGRMEIDTKRYVRVEKIPGGEEADCRVMSGVMLNKDVTHSKMRRRIVRPKILLLDCSLEYKKGESQTNVEITKEEDWDRLLQLEEEHIMTICDDIIRVKPDLVFTEKGVSDLAQHYLSKAGITAIRRLRKTDNNRVARAVGATICSRTDEVQESDLGLGCGLFEVVKIGDEYFCMIDECDDPKACTVILRGGSKDVLNEVERNLQDALQVARNIALDPRVLPGGGALEMNIARALTEYAKTIEGVEQWPLRNCANAFEVIPRTLAENCGSDVVRVMTKLRATHAAAQAKGEISLVGINGNTGELLDMATCNEDEAVWDPYVVKVHGIKTAIENASMMLRIDDILSGISNGARQ
ncbi:T-complex protein 1, gamma subunit [Batrachochytrium salamandrivorans]|nr:T-complex protein 1, gamma subunit [Batrachochytrium salamandrivorans]